MQAATIVDTWGFFINGGKTPQSILDKWLQICDKKKEVNIFHSLFWRKKYISFLCLRMTVAMLHPKLCIYVYFHPIKEKKLKYILDLLMYYWHCLVFQSGYMLLL